MYLKEQYPVTAHAPNFDFWTGCREIKRCEESKRTLKNPFASRLTGFNTTLKLLRITDQWYIVPVKFRFYTHRYYRLTAFSANFFRSNKVPFFFCNPFICRLLPFWVFLQTEMTDFPTLAVYFKCWNRYPFIYLKHEKGTFLVDPHGIGHNRVYSPPPPPLPEGGYQEPILGSWWYVTK